MSIFNPSGGETMKIFVKGIGEVEVSAGGTDPEWERLHPDIEDEDEDDEDEPPFTRGHYCPHCGQAIA